MEFKSTVFLNGKTATGLEVPAEIVERLSAGKKPPVLVTIGDHTYKSTVAVYGGKFMLPLSAENRQLAGAEAGDEVTVKLELDTEPREAAVPEDLAERLAGEAAAGAFFETLSYSNKRRIILNIEQAKTAETRARRIDKAIDSLKEGRI